MLAVAAPFVGIAQQQAAAAGGNHDEWDQAEAKKNAFLFKKVFVKREAKLRVEISQNF